MNAALWRAKSDINMNVGDHIQVINDRNTLYNGVVVNTTQKSTVTVSIQFTPNQNDVEMESVHLRATALYPKSVSWQVLICIIWLQYYHVS